ncbi:hypothetical protein KUCAC02_030443%2C partial [Scomber scombrus]|uniref:Uncharacterized protein n=1 Tax=Scomber scombrus TaxID=13677 RepID=A0AAV1P6J3_SCOSC
MERLCFRGCLDLFSIHHQIASPAPKPISTVEFPGQRNHLKVKSLRLRLPLCRSKLCHPHMGPLASHASSLFSPLIYTRQIKSFDPKKLVTLVETTPRGFHTKAAKVAEGLKSEITVQTFRALTSHLPRTLQIPPEYMIIAETATWRIGCKHPRERGREACSSELFYQLDGRCYFLSRQPISMRSVKDGQRMAE